MSEIIRNSDNIPVDLSSFDNLNCQNKGGVYAPAACPDGQYSPYNSYAGTSYTINTANGLETFYTYCPVYGPCINDPDYVAPTTTTLNPFAHCLYGGKEYPCPHGYSRDSLGISSADGCPKYSACQEKETKTLRERICPEHPIPEANQFVYYKYDEIAFGYVDGELVSTWCEIYALADLITCEEPTPNVRVNRDDGLVYCTDQQEPESVCPEQGDPPVIDE